MTKTARQALLASLTAIAMSSGIAAAAANSDRAGSGRAVVAPQATWRVAAEDSGRSRKTRNIMSVSPNIPDEPAATDVANSGRARADKDGTENGTTGSIGSDAKATAAPTPPATRGLKR